MNDKMLELTIHDTGVGIPPKVLKRVFDPFYTTKKLGEGQGLSLPLVYTTILLHKGTIKIESEIGIGTTVSIKLPIHQNSG